MTALHLHQPEDPSRREKRPVNLARKRAPWRQKLVDAERGFTHGFRTDSTLFVHLFLDSCILLAAAVTGLLAWQWITLALTLVVMLTAELFGAAVRLLVFAGPIEPDVRERVLSLTTAASMLAWCGGGLVCLLVLAQRLGELY